MGDTVKAVAADRSADLRAALDARRRDLVRDIHDRLREGRVARPGGVGDLGDLSDADTREDLDRSLLQMRAETLTRIDAAISQLDEGKYGRCVECDGEIAARRLRALPFAVRCRMCEERGERGNGRARPAVERRAGPLIDLAVPRR
jgi:DnaK suppressor protein